MDGLLGFDPEQLKQLMGQFGATEEDKRDANKQAAFALGFGLLQGRKGNELATIGQAGLGAMGARQSALAMSQDMRQKQLAGAMQAMKAGKEMQFQNMLAGELGGAGGASPATVPGPAPGAPPMSSGFGASSIPQQGAATAAPSAPSDLPRWANPRVEMLAAAGGHKDVADVIHRQMNLTQGPSGTLMRNGAVVGQVIPNVGMVVDGQLVKLPKEATDALVNFEGATAKVKADVASQNELVNLPSVLPNGQPGPSKMVRKSDYLAQQTSQPTAPRGGLILDPNMSQTDMQRAVADYHQQRGGQPQFGMGASPIATKAAEEAITTKEQATRSQQNEINKNFATTFNDAVNAEYQAPAKIAKLTQLKGYLQNVETGKLAPTVLNLKSYAAYVAPDLAKEWTKDVPFAQAAQQLSNEMALQLRNPAGGAGMPGSLSDADREFLTKLIPNIGQDPRAMPMAVDAKIALAKREQQIGQLAREYRKTNGALDEGFYQKVQDYSDAHPLFSGMTPPAAPGTGNVIKYDAQGRRMQ